MSIVKDPVTVNRGKRAASRLMRSSSPTKKQMTNQSVKNSSNRSPSIAAASPSSSQARIPAESPSSLAALSIHHEEVPAFDLVGKKCENQRYSGEVPNKPHVYEEPETVLWPTKSIIDTLN